MRCRDVVSNAGGFCQRRFWPCEHALQLAHMIRPPCRPLPTQHRCCRRRAGFPCLIVRPVRVMLTRGHCRLSRQEIKCFDALGFLFENARPSIGKKPAPSAGGCRTGSRPLRERMRPSALSFHSALAPVVRVGSTEGVSLELAMFFFFSNRIGIIGSIVISLIVTVVVLKACGM